MSAQKSKSRRPANSQESKTVKASVVVGSQLNARWAACAALAGIDKGRFAALAIESACRGLVLIDRRGGAKSARPVGDIDRVDDGVDVTCDDEETRKAG
jgi:hypothetical protein